MLVNTNLSEYDLSSKLVLKHYFELKFELNFLVNTAADYIFLMNPIYPTEYPDYFDTRLFSVLNIVNSLILAYTNTHLSNTILLKVSLNISICLS